MKVGFTGTQRGMTSRQKRDFAHLIVDLDMTEFHHGDCIGADEDAHEIVRAMLAEVKIVIHPPDRSISRAYCSGDFTHATLPYLDRNQQIVNSTSYLIATPNEDKELLRSGTWATVRRAHKARNRVHILYP